MTQSAKIRRITHGISGRLSFPGDKSLSHRAIIFGSLAEGVSRFTNVLAGEDCVCTRKAFEAMGVRIETESPEERRVVYALLLMSMIETKLDEEQRSLTEGFNN